MPTKNPAQNGGAGFGLSGGQADFTSSIKTTHAPRRPQLTPRQTRILTRLLERPAMREELDVVGGASNAPDEVMRLRHKGLAIHCNRIDAYDRDGKHTRPGLYSLDRASVDHARDLLGGVQ